ncbi:MAG: aspartyl-tRNA(Asn)/glutamyl-tRNA(Gln) amidotransferase subunit A [Alteromonas macleodii]|jgi:aspartyl-tRNA(Asn)/glutamyl-tRNA(Gln) amidotransferase subunit A
MPSQYPWSPETVSRRLSDTENRIKSSERALNYVFTQTFFEQAQKQAKNLKAYSASPLCGAIISVKDLFDVDSFITKAGTKFMANDAPASADAPAIKNLRDAGAVFIGHTNMTELAYSGLGLNPHYGTPENAIVTNAIPGGSTSGGAVSVALGIADIAIGTDTGGSLRIPAAFNGIVGFKPSQHTISRAGSKPLSRSLDSVGPMAKTVAACSIAYEFLSGGEQDSAKDVEPDFIIPTNYGMDDLEPAVGTAFVEAVAILKKQGYKVDEKFLTSLEDLKELPIWHFAAIESRGEYDEAYQNQRDLIDPRVSSSTRMGRADEVNAVTYRQTLNQRQELIEKYKSEIGNKILLMPTTPILPPSISAMESDVEYGRVNLQVLRNPSIGNVMDCCSISLPFKFKQATIGVMLTATSGHDLSLLKLARTIEDALTLA